MVRQVWKLPSAIHFFVKQAAIVVPIKSQFLFICSLTPLLRNNRLWALCTGSEMPISRYRSEITGSCSSGEALLLL